MRHKIIHTLRIKITLITVFFSLAVAVLLSTFSFISFRAEARKSVIQSAEFNLQFIAGVLRQELASLDMLSRWSTSNTQIANWLADEHAPTRLSLELYDSLREEILNNKSAVYIRRIIITDAGSRKLLQVGNNMSDSKPVTIYNLAELGLSRFVNASVLRACAQDPYAIGEQSQVMPIIRPIRQTGSLFLVGYAYLAVSVDIILDRLENYRMASGGNIYLTLPDAVYRVEGRKFVDVSDELSMLSARSEETLSHRTLVRDAHLKKSGSTLMITCPLDIEEISISQSLSEEQFYGNPALYLQTIAIIAAAALLFSAFIVLLLNRVITQPVFRLRKKIDGIAESDFAADPGIEWDNELGDIGRGINEMSGKIVALLETRLADEKNKRDLEYRMLQSQINPHFLYNTLNSIKWMATMQHAAGIAEMTTALSRLIRNVIKGNRTIVTLQEELALLDDYFVIQQYRYGGAITFEKRVPEDLLLVSVPCFTLQPLMENAIFHGIEPKGGSGSIILSAATNDAGDVEICMEDDGIGMSEERIAEVSANENQGAASGFFIEIGVASVDRRIAHSFGEKYGLRMTSELGKFTKASIIVPWNKET